MKFGSKSFLLFLAVIVFVVLAFFAVTSKKSLISNSDDKVATISEDKNEENESEDIEDGDEEVDQITLEIISPKEDSVVTESSVWVSGVTVEEAEVFVNDAETKADGDGKFKVKVTLEEGENEIFVVANDSEGNYAEASVTIILNTE